MKIIPLLRCPNLKEAIDFYTTVLDFSLKYPDEAGNDWGNVLVNNGAELMIARVDGPPCTVVFVGVENVDEVFRKYVERGLLVPNNPDSPVHNSPIDQTWGLREFYVDNPAGNTLRFASPIK